MIITKKIVHLMAFAVFFAPATAFADSEIYRPAVDIVRQEFNLPNLNVEITQASVYQQTDELKNNIQFENALRLALKSYLNDYSDEESPLAILYSLKNNCDGGDITAEAAQNIKVELRELLNKRTTVLRLLAIDEKPQGRGSVKTSWIFSLIMPQVYDAEYFAVVDRLGKISVFNYGFN